MGLFYIKDDFLFYFNFSTVCVLICMFVFFSACLSTSPYIQRYLMDCLSLLVLAVTALVESKGSPQGPWEFFKFCIIFFSQKYLAELIYLKFSAYISEKKKNTSTKVSQCNLSLGILRMFDPNYLLQHISMLETIRLKEPCYSLNIYHEQSMLPTPSLALRSSHI